MNLLTANAFLDPILVQLGLDPATTPKDEFLAELHFMRLYLGNPDCIHINITDLDGDSPIAMTITPDSIVDGIGRETLRFSYCGGDNIPSGPHHALIITDLIHDRVVYKRNRGQNPQTKWEFNILARGQIGFRFTADEARPAFMGREAYAEFMLEYGVADHLKLNLDTHPEFLAEVAYLGYWNAANQDLPLKEGIEFDPWFINDKQAIITITCNDQKNIDPVVISYIINPDSGHYALTIMDGDNLIYERNADQDEATEWVINGMADDPMIDDGYGKPLFAGDIIGE